MTQPDFRQLLINLLRLAKDAYEMRLQHFKRTGRDELPPIKRLPDQPTNPQPPFTLDGRRFFQAITISREDMNNYPFTQLGFAAHDVFRYPKSLWPANLFQDRMVPRFDEIIRIALQQIVARHNLSSNWAQRPWRY